MTDERTKASSCGGKVHDKDKGIIAQSAQHNRNVLINERSIENKGEHRGIKWSCESLNRKRKDQRKVIKGTKEQQNPLGEHLGNSSVVGRQLHQSPVETRPARQGGHQCFHETKPCCVMELQTTCLSQLGVVLLD